MKLITYLVVFNDFICLLDGLSQHLIWCVFTCNCVLNYNLIELRLKMILLLIIFEFTRKFWKRVSSRNVTKRLIFQNTRQRFVTRRRSFHLLLMYVYPTKEHVVQLQSEREKGVRECERMYETRSKQTTMLT